MTTNDQFYAASLTKKVERLWAEAAEIRSQFTLAWGEYVESKGDEAERSVLRERAYALCERAKDAEEAAWQASLSRRSFLATR